MIHGEPISLNIHNITIGGNVYNDKSMVGSLKDQNLGIMIECGAGFHSHNYPSMV